MDQGLKVCTKEGAAYSAMAAERYPLIQLVHMPTADAALDAVRANDCAGALLPESSALYLTIQRENCDLKIIGQVLMRQNEICGVGRTSAARADTLSYWLTVS